MNHDQEYHLPPFAKVNTIHILKDGEVITSLQAYESVKHRFDWVDQAYVISEMVRLQGLTESPKKSLIVIYEDAQVVKEYVNVDESFQPLAFC